MGAGVELTSPHHDRVLTGHVRGLSQAGLCAGYGRSIAAIAGRCACERKALLLHSSEQLGRPLTGQNPQAII
jgi:hypothetical protein